MAEFLIGDVRQVARAGDRARIDLHLRDGWVLLMVRPGVIHDRNPETGVWENLPNTSYVVDWTGEDESKNVGQYDEEKY
ncbi:hypothetical protein [Pseudomonas syringae]|uniref:hypothetical protein n=1 Tax=Pseudomonas syringae TaxID=317 RepID=UPI0032048BD8